MPKASRGQAIGEYAVLLAAVSLAVAGMQVYARRSVQAQIRNMADLVGSQTEGIRYETGERRDKTAKAGRTLVRQSKQWISKARSMTETANPGGGKSMVINHDIIAASGNLDGNGRVSYSEVAQ